jgi:hypothetical protein
MKPAHRKRWRKMLGLSVLQLARLLCTHPSTVYRWEENDRPIDGFAGAVFTLIATKHPQPFHPKTEKWAKAAGYRVCMTLAAGGPLDAVAALLDELRK